MAMAKHQQGDALFIDARPAGFYDQMHIKGATSLPLTLFDLMYMMDLGSVSKTKDIIVYGRTLSSLYDEHVARKLILRGHKNTMVLNGGQFGLFANHSLVMANYIARANAAIIDLRKLLQEG